MLLMPRAVRALLAVAIMAGIGLGAVMLLRGGSGSGVALRSSPSVVVAVRDLARLESAEFHIERIIDLRDRQSALFGLVKTQDAILLVAVGSVTAGVDLSLLADGDVVVDLSRGVARIVLPPTMVLSTRLDNERSWVYARTTDLLAQRHEDLETRARLEAERTLQQTAIDGGILERARANSERTVAALVRSLGYADVTVTSRPEAPR